MEINLIYDIPWGSHMCMFYKAKNELISGLVSYFKTGLENNEFCIWALPDSIEAETAKSSLNEKLGNLGYYLDRGQIEIRNYQDYYLKEGEFSAFALTDWWLKREKDALGQGFSGIRIAGDGTDLFNAHAFKMNLYEKEIDKNIGQLKMKAICTYSLDKIDTLNILNIIAYHQSTIVNRNSVWEVFKAAEINSQFA
ncbi:MAG: MEDS domain-containing protein [Candidatus Omnitrophica bacterium]|nr:MEDS domain-containing protein [Candidatus Omnitrophota bacterium]